MSDTLTLNIYDDKDNVIKTVNAKKTDLEFGIVRRMMELFQVDNLEDNIQIFKMLYEAWEPITHLLNRIFPDVGPEDFDHVKIKELVPVVMEILMYSVAEILESIGDSKNQRTGTMTPRFTKVCSTLTISCAKSIRHLIRGRQTKNDTVKSSNCIFRRLSFTE